jgi:hypothetical protein
MSATLLNGKPCPALEVAYSYHDRCWCPIPVPFRSKIPQIPRWQELRPTRAQLADLFSGKTNIGIVLGEASNWLIDVDLDHPLAVELAPQYLPPTGAVFGRAGNPRSHWEYRLAREAKTKQFSFPRSGTKPETDGKKIVEFRSTGAQTVFPGSIHESGEPIEWAGNGEPAEVDPDELLASIDELAQEVRRRLGYKPDEASGKTLPKAKQDKSKHATRPAPIDVVDRARKYLAKVVPAVSGSGGHNQTIYAAGKLIRGFGLAREQALQLLGEWNQLCQPPWSAKELEHKVDNAIERPGERGYLLNAQEKSRGATGNGVAAEKSAVSRVEAAEDDAEPLRFERLTSAELDAYDAEIEYLVNDIWPAAQGGIISGRFKTLKTNIAIALGMSASLGTAFLDRFHVGRAIRVGIMSAESGAKTLRERGQAIAASMGVGLADCSNLIWSTASPRLARVDHLAALRQFILDDALEGLIVDPTYLALCDIGSDSSNVFKMGAVLAPLTELIQQTACSIVLVNHNIKGRSKDLARFDAPDLAEVSMSGFMEWARFWCLLGPRQEWSEDTGEHWLWLRTGGSAGHAGLWHLDVAEGKRSDPGGRRWEVAIIGATEGKRNTAIEREAAKQGERQEAQRIKIDADKVAILNAAAAVIAGDTEAELKRRSRVRTERFNEAFTELTGDKQLVPVKVVKGNNRTYPGFRIPPDPKEDPLAHMFCAGGTNE